MNINDIEAKYSSFALRFPSILSNFSACSINNNVKPPVALVTSTIDCYNFDRVKDNLHSTYLKSVDSLFISRRLNTVFFIEFKDSSYEKSIGKVVKKAFCSLHLHHELCCFTDYGFCGNCLCLVLSADKELVSKNNESLMTNTMLRFANYPMIPSIREDLVERLKNHMKSSAKIDAMPLFYSNFMIVFNNEFDNFANNLI